MAENIKVAVRLRGFNEREKALNSKCVVEMNGNTTIIKASSEAKEAEKRFAFDYSYWSFDGFKTEPDGYFAPDGPSSIYCDQKKVFDDLGIGIINNAFDGYNASIFAYGQTGSGKSYSIFGFGANKGLVPLVCEKIFSEIDEKKKLNPENQFEVTFTMIEIYNEAVRDLLSTKSALDRKGLQLHEKPGRGFYILEKDLKPTQVVNYQGIVKLMEQGNANKSIAETKMNATSSRAHTIIELIFKQTFKNDSGNVMQRMSVIDLVDLAGSERSNKTGAEGDRLKEGIAINLSLTSLGNVIAALASQAGGQTVRVPYRDSTLTKLLMNALGGNSKTVMIAAISPSDNNHAETLSTLRYADRAKQIKCNAKVNEDPKDKIIRELQEEIMKLKGQVKGGVVFDHSDLSKKEYDKAKKEMEDNLKKQIEDNEKQMEQMKLTYEQKLAEALAKSKELDKSTIVNEKAKICPHFSNINIDPMLTGSLKHLIEFENGKTKLLIGSADSVDIQIHGVGVSDRHAGISFENGDFYIEPYANSRIMKNGKQHEEKFILNNFDRLVFGASSYYLFVNPSKFDQDSELMITQIQTVTVEKIHQEIAEQSGLISSSFDYKKPDELQCINELIDLMPLVEEANQMSILLDKKMRYDLMILNPIVIGDPHSKPKPMITVKKFGTTLEWLWDSAKFIDRKSLMSEYYLDFKEDGKIDTEMFKKYDPFIDAEDEPVLIGTGVVEPRCILHRIPLNDDPKVFDYCKKLVGSMHVDLLPCDKQGIVYENIEKSIIHNPEKDLKELFFLVRLSNVKCLNTKYKKIFCQYKIFGDEQPSKTEAGKEANTSSIKYQRMVSFDKVEPNLINYYSSFPLFVQLCGVQVSAVNDSKKMTTREWFNKEKNEKFNSVEKLNEQVIKLQAELDRTKNKLKNLETLLDFADSKKKKKIQVDYVRECVLSNDPDVMKKLHQLVNQSKD